MKKVSIGWIFCLATTAGTALAQQASPKSDKALADLERIGSKLAQMVLDKDVESLLRYDRADRLCGDKIMLREKKSDLYCYLFDSSCIPRNASYHSVFETISKARRLGVTAIGSKKEGHRYATLYFYDRFQISEELLRSTKWFCTQGGWTKVAFWPFELVDGKWQSASLPFDYATDSFCPTDSN
jgi:hypothetical protein